MNLNAGHCDFLLFFVYNIGGIFSGWQKAGSVAGRAIAIGTIVAYVPV